MGFGQQLLELVVLGLAFTQSPGVGYVRAAVFGAPL